MSAPADAAILRAHPAFTAERTLSAAPDPYTSVAAPASAVLAVLAASAVEGAGPWDGRVATALVLRAVEATFGGAPAAGAVAVARAAVDRAPTPDALELRPVLDALDALGAPRHPVLAPLAAHAVRLRLAGALPAATAVLEGVVRLAREREDAEALTEWYLELASAHVRLAAWDRAERALAVARETAEAHDHPRLARQAMGRLAEVCLERGRLGEARALCETIVRATEGAVADDERAGAFHILGAVEGRQGNHELAAHHLHASFACAAAPRWRFWALSLLGEAFTNLEILDSARHCFAVAATLADPGDQWQRLAPRLGLLDVAAREGRRGEVERRLAALGDAPLPPVLAFTRALETGYAWQRLGERRRAADALREALALAERHGLHHRRFQVEEELDRVEAALRARASAAARGPRERLRGERESVERLAAAVGVAEVA